MNTLKVASAIIFTLLASNVGATKYLFIGTNNTVETKMCVSSGNNDKTKLKRLIRRSNDIQSDSVRAVANHILCNDMVIAHFAHKYGANDTFNYLNRVTYKRDRLPQTSVTIRDIAMNMKDDDIHVIYIAAH